MPLYRYACNTCESEQDNFQSVDDRHVSPVCSHCGLATMNLVIMPTMVTPDIAPYKAMAGDRAGQYITSRAQHREFLKRNRFVEIGNEPMKPIKNDTRPKKGEVAAELKRVIPQVLAKHRG